MNIQLSDHFTFRKLIRFILPPIGMMMFTSIYSVVDGFFVSNFVGKTAFASVNLIMPIIMILGALGFVLGTGGSALVAKTLGEGEKKKANEIFSLMVYVGIIIGVVLAIIGIVFMKSIAIALGAEGEMIDLCARYARVCMLALPGFMLQNIFQSFLVTAEKPTLGLIITVAAGVTNMILDALFMVVFPFGVAGAALATGLSQILGGVVPLIFFIRKNNSALKLVKWKFDGRALLRASLNGSSEFVTNVSMSIVAILYNFQLLKYAGEDGIAAYGVIMYVAFLFAAIFLGYAIGVTPLVGYHYGAGNKGELRNLLRKSFTLIIVAGAILGTVGIVFSPLFTKAFVGYDQVLYEMTNHGFKVYAISFYIFGIGMFGSAWFTALNNGTLSALISCFRILVFQSLAIIILPMIWGLEGIWYAIVVAEVLSATFAIICIMKNRKKYLG